MNDIWSIPANLRWLSEQSDRPNYVPCGELTGKFLKETATRFENNVAHIRQLEADKVKLREVVEEAAKTFRRYQALHRNKGTKNGEAKAETNRDLAIKLETSLQETAR